VRVEIQSNALLKRRGGYNELRDQYPRLKTQSNKYKDQIAIDVFRTRQRFTTDTENMSTMLANVLMAYANWDVELGYTQGMNFIVVVILQVYSGKLNHH
jgi:hypothetical protein